MAATSRALMLTLCLAGGAGTALGGSPLVSPDILSDTYDLIYDAYSMAWDKADVNGILAKVPLDDIKKTISQQMAAIPPEVTQALTEMQTKSVQLKALAYEYADMAFEPVNAAAVEAIEKLEAALPSRKGLIKKTIGGLALFTVYMCIVFYVLLKLALLALRVAKCLLCFVCCCGCCCLRGSKGTAANGKAKAKAKAGDAAGKKGKAAAQTQPTNATKKGK